MANRLAGRAHVCGHSPHDVKQPESEQREVLLEVPPGLLDDNHRDGAHVVDAVVVAVETHCVEDLLRRDLSEQKGSACDAQDQQPPAMHGFLSKGPRAGARCQELDARAQ
eukprot:scaffold26288_cov111-Isochrysis_galbana.AAC.14